MSMLVIVWTLRENEEREGRGRKGGMNRAKAVIILVMGILPVWWSLLITKWISYRHVQIWFDIGWEIKGTKFCDEVLMLLNYFQDSFNKICDDKFFPHDVKMTLCITRDLETEMLRLVSALWMDSSRFIWSPGHRRPWPLSLHASEIIVGCPH